MRLDTHRAYPWCALPLALLLGGTPVLGTPASRSPLPTKPLLLVPGQGPHYRLINKIPLAGNEGWDYLTLDSVNRRLYVTRSTHVDVFDADSGFLVGQISPTNGVHGVAVAPELGLGWASDGQDNAVTPFRLDTLTPYLYPQAQRTAITVTGIKPDCIVYDPATRRVFTFNGGSDSATAINAKTGGIVGTIPLGGRPEFAVADGHGMIYDNLEDKSEIVAIDARTLAVKATWPLAPVTGPSGIAMDTVHRRLFSVGGNQRMAVVDADTGTVLAAPAIGAGPDACKFDPVFQVALSSNGRDGTLTVVQEQTPQTFRVVGTVPTQVGARTMAVDAKTHNVWLIAASYNPVPPGASPRTRPTIQDGSVVLLELAPVP